MKRVAILLAVLIVMAPCPAFAQAVAASSGKDKSKDCCPAAQSVPVNNGTAKLSVKIAETEKITLRNRFGPIVVTGVGGDTLEANVVITRPGTSSNLKLHLVASHPGRDKVMIATVVTEDGPERTSREKEKSNGTAAGVGAGQRVAQQSPPPPRQPAQPSQTRPGAQGGGPVRTPRPPRPVGPALTQAMPLPSNLRGVAEIRLEIRLPRNAHLELVDSRRYAIVTSGNPNYLTNTRNDVAVTNMETPVSITSSGDVQVSKVGAVEVRTRAGSISIKEVAGPIHVISATGAILVKDAGGDVRAVSISGPISIECARGRIEANTTNGLITLAGIGGDLEASTTGGTISYMGAIRDKGRYRMRSMSGQVRMLIQGEPPGFQASVSSYKGQVVVDFPLKSELSGNTATSDLPATQTQSARRMTGRFGEGDTRINLDSFSGTVQLGRAPAEGAKGCR